MFSFSLHRIRHTDCRRVRGVDHSLSSPPSSLHPLHAVSSFILTPQHKPVSCCMSFFTEESFRFDRTELFCSWWCLPSVSITKMLKQTKKKKMIMWSFFKDQILLSHFERNLTFLLLFCISFSYSWLLCCYCLGENRSLTFWCKMWFRSVSLVSFYPSGGWICGSHSICSSSQLLLPPWDV